MNDAPFIVTDDFELYDRLSNNPKQFITSGFITYIDNETMKCSVRMDDNNEYIGVPIYMSGAGPRSQFTLMPELGSKVLVGWKQSGRRLVEPVILGYVNTGIYQSKDFKPFSVGSPEEIKNILNEFPDLGDIGALNLGVTRLKSKKVNSGDVLALSSKGSDLTLDKNFYLSSRDGQEIFTTDDSVIHRIKNTFVSGSHGYERKGIIKRSGFNLPPDLIMSGQETDGEINGKDIEDYINENIDGNGEFNVKKIDINSPAFRKLSQFGLVDTEGNVLIDYDKEHKSYPYVTTPSGNRVSYVHNMFPDSEYDDTKEMYVENRLELFHTDDGSLKVNEETDGFQIDHPLQRVFITDVVGTVVGNDAYSKQGRQLYKKILSASLFTDPSGWVSPDKKPALEPIDMIHHKSWCDSTALAKYFSIKAPEDSSNEYVFGVTKEGRVFLHVPKSKTGNVDQIGKSVDMTVSGLINAVIGSDTDGKSLRMKTSGGMELDIGTFKDDENKNISLDVKLRGRVNLAYLGAEAVETTYGGDNVNSVAGRSANIVGGDSINITSARHVIQAERIENNASSMASMIGGSTHLTVLGNANQYYGMQKSTTLALGRSEKMLTGTDSQIILAGAKSLNMISGSFSENIAAGSKTVNVGTGNFSATVGAGNLSMTVGAGSLSLSTGGGSSSIQSAIMTNVTSGAVTNITSPLVRIGMVGSFGSVSGIPGPPGPHIDYVTGVPIMGMSTILVG